MIFSVDDGAFANRGGAMKTVRAAENRVTVVDVDEPPGAGELLEMTAPSVCASDLMYIRLGSRQILGHERRPPSRRHRRSTR